MVTSLRALALLLACLAGPGCHAHRVDASAALSTATRDADAELGGEGEGGVRDLMREASRGQYGSTRARAMKALYDLGSMAEEAAGVFTTGLIDSEENVRRYAYAGLEGLGKEKAPSDAVRVVARSASKGQYGSTRARAMHALWLIGERSKEQAVVVVNGLIDDDDTVRRYAQKIYDEILGSAPESAVRFIADTYRKAQYDSTKIRCFNAFVILDQDAKPAAYEISVALSEPNGDVRRLARHMLGVVKTTTSSAVSYHAKNLRSGEYDSTRIRAINALLWLGNSAEPTIDDITWALMDGNSDVRKVAMKIINTLGKVDSQMVAKIGRYMVKAEYTSTRERAAWTLANLGGAAKPAQNDLIDTMSSNNANLAKWARQALKNIQDAERVPEIVEPKKPTKDPSKAEDAECFCFNKMDYDEEAEHQKVGFAQCAGMAGTEYRCDKHCNKKEKYHVSLSSEVGTQTVSYCQDDGDCKCLDAQESASTWEYKLIHTFQVTQDKRLQSMNLGECYSKCNDMCKDAGWKKGGCVWPKDD